MFGIFGNIQSPLNTLAPGKYSGTQGEGLFVILNNVIKFMIVIAGLYTFLNIILAGYIFLSAGGDPKNIGKAWEKIWQSIIGLILVAGSFLLAAIIGWILFGDFTALITPRLYTP